MNLRFQAMSFCVVTALVLAPVPSSAQTIPVLPVEAVPNVPFTSYFDHVFAVSPNGRLIAATTIGTRGDLTLWDLATGRLLRVLKGHTDKVNTLMFSPDGKRLLSAGRDKTIKLWDPATGQTIRTFVGHADAVNAVAISSDGSRILSASDDKTVKLWDVATTQLVRTYAGHTRKVSSIAISPDGSRVLSGDATTARLWDVATGQLLRTFNASSHASHSAVGVAYLPDGVRVVFGGDRVTLWDTASDKLLRTFESNPPTGRFFASARSLVVSSDGNRVAADVLLGRKVGRNERCPFIMCPQPGSDVFDMSVKIVWDITTGQQLELLTTGVISVDGTYIYPAEPGVGNLRNLFSGQVVHKFQQRKFLLPEAAALSPNGQAAALAGSKWIKIWNTSTGKLTKTITINNSAEMLAIAFSPGGDKVIAIAAGNPTVTIWDVATGRLLNSFNFAGMDFIRSKDIALTPDRSAAVISARSDFIGLWDLSTGALLRKFVPSGYVACLAISPDGNRVAVGTDRVTLWDATTGRLVRELHLLGKGDHISALAFSPDGTKLLSAAISEPLIKVWDPATGNLLLDIKDVIGAHVTFSPDGKYFVARYQDAIKQWDVATGQLVRSLDVKIFDESTSFAASADGTRFAQDTSYGLTLWSMQTGKLLATLIPSETTDDWVVFTPEGYFDGSKNAADMFTVVRGLDVIERDEVEKTLRRPELLRQKLKGSPVARP